MTLLGKALFWPSKKWMREPEGRAVRRASATRSDAGRGASSRRRAVLLAALGVFALGFNASFDFNSSLPDDVESTEAIETFNEQFGAGASELIPGSSTPTATPRWPARRPHHLPERARGR